MMPLCLTTTEKDGLRFSEFDVYTNQNKFFPYPNKQLGLISLQSKKFFWTFFI